MKTDNNYGADAYKQGVADCESIYSIHGMATIKRLAKYSTNKKDDYSKGKIEQARKILSSKTK